MTLEGTKATKTNLYSKTAMSQEPNEDIQLFVNCGARVVVVDEPISTGSTEKSDALWAWAAPVLLNGPVLMEVTIVLDGLVH